MTCSKIHRCWREAALRFRPPTVDSEATQSGCPERSVDEALDGRSSRICDCQPMIVRVCSIGARCGHQETYHGQAL